MGVMYSHNVPLDSLIPAFTVQDVRTNEIIDERFSRDHHLVVAFMCNHCPYVVHILDAWIELAQRYQKKGVSFLMVSSNDAEQFPQDGPERMRELAIEKQIPFPYAVDASQAMARSFQAVCTPDFYLFCKEKRRLVYHGRFDGNPFGSERAPTGEDLAQALDALLHGDRVAHPQNPSQGCSIKWKAKEMD